MRAFLAVTCALSVWLVVEVGVFASRYVGQLAERDLIGLAPLLFIGFVLWLARGGPRGYWPMAIAGVLTAAPLVALPLKRLVTSSAPPDAPSLIPFYDLLKASSLLTLELVFFLAAAAAILIFALVPRRALTLLPITLLATLVAGSVAASRYAADQGHLRQQTYLGPDVRWVDHAADRPVAYVYRRGDDWIGVWETVFWNRRINHVYDLAGAHVFGPMPQQRTDIRPDGTIVNGTHTIQARYVVTATGAVSTVPGIVFIGKQIATTIQPGNTQAGLALWRIKPPLRLISQTSGLKPNGDIQPGGDGHIVAYACDGHWFQLTLIIKQAQTVQILRNGTLYQLLTFPSPTIWRSLIAAVPQTGVARGQNQCTLDLHPTGLLGTTVFQVQ